MNIICPLHQNLNYSSFLANDPKKVTCLWPPSALPKCFLRILVNVPHNPKPYPLCEISMALNPVEALSPLRAKIFG